MVHAAHVPAGGEEPTQCRHARKQLPPVLMLRASRDRILPTACAGKIVIGALQAFGMVRELAQAGKHQVVDARRELGPGNAQ